jgi:VRR-NUC domain.
MIDERDIEAYLKIRVGALGGLCWKFTSPGNAGVPDRMILIEGIVWFVEVKAPNKVLSRLQAKRIRELHAKGFRAAVVSDMRAVDILIDALKSQLDIMSGQV